MLGRLIGLGGGESRLPVLTRIFWNNVKLAVSQLTEISAAITRISLTSGEGLMPIYSIVFVLAIDAIAGAYLGTHTCIVCMKQVLKAWLPACFS